MTSNKTTRVDKSSRELDSVDAESLDLVCSRLYHIYHTTFRHDYKVSDTDKTPLYYVDNSVLTPKKPDLTFHAGEDPKAPITGVCKFLHFSRHCKLGLGDPQKVRDMVWEDLFCQNFRLSKYHWQMAIRTADGGFERRSFLWKRTHSVGVHGESPSKLSPWNYKLMEEHTGQIVAVFTNNGLKSFQKAGKLQVGVDYGPDFDLLVLITLLAIYEKQRRRSNGSKGGGGGRGWIMEQESSLV